MRRLAHLLAAIAIPLALAAGEAAAQAQGGGDRRLVLVTLDGLHWTELFRGADPARAADKAFVHDLPDIRKRFVETPDRASIPGTHR